MLTALALLAAIQASQPARGLRVEELPEGRFRIIVAGGRSDADPGTIFNAMARAEMATRREAARRCAERGGPVPVDRGLINMLPEHRWEAIQTFACRNAPMPTPAPAAPAPTGG